MTSEANVEWVQWGEGAATNFLSEVEGPLVEVEGAEDVLAVMDTVDEPGWERPILLVHEAGGTTLGPMLGHIAGVISTKGTLGAHVALLAKEYGCPCIVGAKLDGAAADVRRASVRPDGTIWGNRP